MVRLSYLIYNYALASYVKPFPSKKLRSAVGRWGKEDVREV